MLITKFNKLIRSKIVWGAFATLISISFLGFMGAGFSMRDSDSPQSRNAYGSLYGEDVPGPEYLACRFFEQGMRPQPSLSPEAEKALGRRTWIRLAALREAREIGLSTSDAEMTETITRDPSFAVDGVFSRAMYTRTVQEQLRVPITTFEEYLRQELTLRKVARTLETAIWTSPFELTEKVRNLSDLFTLEYFVIDSEAYEPEVTVTEEDARAFYTAHEKTFTVPAMLNVKYVEFPISNQLATAKVTEEQIAEYYDAHIDEYSSTATNGAYETTPLDDVRGEIESALILQTATFQAKDLATEFAVALAPDRSGSAPSMPSLAASRSMPLSTSTFFAADGPVVDLDVGPDFARAAFALDPKDPERYFSDALVGGTAAYVIAVNTRNESRVPEFEEVSEEALAFAREEAVQRAREEHFEALRQSLVDAVQSGSNFTSVALQFTDNIVTTEPFAVYSSLADALEYSQALLPAITSLNKGDVTPPLQVTDGLLVAAVADRQPGDPSTMQLLRPELQATLDRYRSRILFNDWGESLLAEADFKDFREQPVEEDAEDSETGKDS